MILDSLVTNRNSSASYGADDLNRVYEAVQYLAGLMEAEGYALNLAEMPQWTQTDIPSLAQMTGYLENVHQIKTFLSATTRMPSTMNKSQYTDWNNIERVLLEADTLIQNMIAAYYYAGDLYSGEEFDGN